MRLYVRCGIEAGQFHGRHFPSIVFRRGSRRGRGTLDQPCEFAVSCLDSRTHRCRGEEQQRGTFTDVDSALPTPELAHYISATMEETEEAMRTVFDLAMIAASLGAPTG